MKNNAMQIQAQPQTQPQLRQPSAGKRRARRRPSGLQCLLRDMSVSVLLVFPYLLMPH